MSGCTCDHNPHKASCPYYGEGAAVSGDAETLAEVLATEIRMFADAHGSWVASDLARHVAEKVVTPRDAAIRAEARAWEEWASTWLADYPHGETQRMHELRAALRAAQPTEVQP